MSRSRSFQRTLRDSFRQLRRHRSESDQKLDQKTAEQQPTEEGEKQEQKAETTDAPGPDKASEPETTKVEIVEETKKEETSEKLSESGDKIEKIEEQQKSDTKTEEKVEEKTEIELIPTTDETSKEEAAKPETTKQEGETSPPASPTKAKPAVAKDLVTVMATVNSLSFADTVLLQGHNLCATLWVGTVAGHVLIFQLTVPEADKRNEEDVKCVLAKEIHLKHGAPVVATFVIDRNSHPVSGAVKSAENEASAQQTGHRVVVCTQQQVKIFSLPTLKAHNKYKLTPHEADAHFTEAHFANFVSKSDEAYTEPDLVCLTDHGRAHVLSVPQLRLQIQSDAMFADSTLSGLTSFGGVYNHYASELREFSLSARQHVPKFSVPLKEGMRPVPEPEPAETAVVEEPEKDAAKDPQTETVEAPTEKTEQPASGDCDKPVDESVVSVNDSMAAGDITADSIKVHVKEESSSVVVTEGDLSSHKVVETMVHSVKTVGGVTEESKVTTIEEMKKIEGLMSTCTVTSSTTSSAKVQESTMVTSSSTVTAVEG